MNDTIQVYLSAWPTVWAMDTARYLVGATLMATILALFWRAGLARRKLQARDATGADKRREILASLRTAFIFSLLGAIVAVGDHQGWITIYKGFQQAGPLYLVGSLALILVAHDTYFYWAHRAMHHRRLFALFHRTHHLSRTPTPWAAYSFAVPEAVVHAAFVPLFLLFVPMHGLGLLAFGIVQILRNVMGHAGAEVHPASFGPGRWLGWRSPFRRSRRGWLGPSPRRRASSACRWRGTGCWGGCAPTSPRGRSAPMPSSWPAGWGCS